MSQKMIELAGKVIEENAAWKARNTARRALHGFFRKYRDEGGEYFDREEMVRCGEMEDVRQFDELHDAVKAAQRELTSKRCAVRRAITRINESEKA